MNSNNSKLYSNSKNLPLNLQDANRSKGIVQFKSKTKVIQEKTVIKSGKEDLINMCIKPTISYYDSVSETTQFKKVIENKDEFSFTDTDCGEIQQSQRIIIDFSQNESDNPVSRQKCKDFWDFINKNPDLDKYLTEHDSEALELNECKF